MWNLYVAMISTELDNAGIVDKASIEWSEGAQLSLSGFVFYQRLPTFTCPMSGTLLARLDKGQSTCTVNIKQVFVLYMKNTFPNSSSGLTRTSIYDIWYTSARHIHTQNILCPSGPIRPRYSKPSFHPANKLLYVQTYHSQS